MTRSSEDRCKGMLCAKIPFFEIWEAADADLIPPLPLTFHPAENPPPNALLHSQKIPVNKIQGLFIEKTSKKLEIFDFLSQEIK